MRKIEVRLVQDTPMWHFQGASEDCCLRASEVKPKLDRFLVTKIGRGEIPDSWWINKEQGALNYKMRISVSGREILESLVTDKGRDGRPRFDNNGNPKMKNLYPIYFGNMGPNAPRNMRLVKFEGIKLEIIVPNEVAEKKTDENASDKTLGDIISENLPQFFAGTSFGTRQDKGFGCFRVVGSNAPVSKLSGASYYFVVPPSGNNDKKYEDLFQHINYFHKVIRSGVNERGCYVKSLMYHYAKEKEDVWDKPVIRTAFNFRSNLYRYICGEISVNDLSDREYKKVTKSGNTMNPVRENLQRDEYMMRNMLLRKKGLYRDALGLATSQDWVFYGNKVKTVLHNDADVRFKSPVDYRPVPAANGGFVVYIILHELPDELRRASFDISSDRANTTLTEMKISDSMKIFDYFDFIYNHCWLVEQDEVDDSNVVDIQKGKENGEPYRFVKQVFRTLERVNR